MGRRRRLGKPGGRAALDAAFPRATPEYSHAWPVLVRLRPCCRLGVKRPAGDQTGRCLGGCIGCAAAWSAGGLSVVRFLGGWGRLLDLLVLDFALVELLLDLG